MAIVIGVALVGLLLFLGVLIIVGPLVVKKRLSAKSQLSARRFISGKAVEMAMFCWHRKMAKPSTLYFNSLCVCIV